MKGFATITTFDHLPKCLAMASSIHRFLPDIAVCVLVIDKPGRKFDFAYQKGRLEILDISILESHPEFQKIYRRHRRNSDRLRWASKPCFLSQLIKQHDFEQLFFVDNDLFFFQSPEFLFNELEGKSVLLTPHWRCLDPTEQPLWFDVNFTDGVYNAGFVGFTKKGLPALAFWARACAYKCEKNFKKGRFDDQKYLDLVPAAFDDVGILNHRGCNVAFWNKTENKRQMVNGKVTVNGQWPVIFVHFTRKMIEEIERGKEPLLQQFLDEYLLSVEMHDKWSIPA